jgi:hypothetical protein
MAKPENPGARDERRKLLELLDRLDTVRPGRHCLPDVLVDRWMHGDADIRRKIEESIDRLPRQWNF